MGEMEDMFDVDGVDSEVLRKEIIDAVIDYANNRPRNLQKEIGPSGVGTPCNRKLAYAVNYEDRHGPNKYLEVLPSLIGTSMHLTMEDVIAMWNAKIVMEQQRVRHGAGVVQNPNHHPIYGGDHADYVTEYANLADAITSISDGSHVGPLRFLSENKVPNSENSIAGTCDLYDTWTHTIVDWKFLGPTTFGKYAKKRPATPPVGYKVQVQVYGAGMVALGHRVETVGIMMIPRSGILRNAVLWTAPFDPAIATEAIRRKDAVEVISDILRVSTNPYKYQHIPATPSESDCFFCPHFNPVPDSNPYHCVGTAGEVDDDGHLIDPEPE